MKNFSILLNHLVIIFAVAVTSCCGQVTQNQTQQAASNDKNKIVGGGCETCQYMYLGAPKEIKSVSYSPGWTEKGQKLLVTGIVYKLDGKTPAPNILLYYWQTDDNGLYSPKEGMTEGTKRHGHIRGWVKTDENGKYSIYTIRPAPYPSGDEPAHVHVVVKEPNISNEYYIDEFVFDEDKLLLPAMKRRPLENRGGSGIMRIYHKDDLQIAEHNIILGSNIPDYPETIKTEKQSGLNIGEDNPSFIPFHAWGPDKGSRACPVCRYGSFLGVIYFVGKNPDWSEIRIWLTYLEEQSVRRGKFLKAYFVYGDENNYDKAKRDKQLAAIGSELNLKNVALTFVPSLSDTESEVNLNKINPDARNTFVVFRRRNIIAKFIDFKPNGENLTALSAILDKFSSEYFDLENSH
jgi:protocatechuate 3,4-dioxygenase, beta subunit